jgi:hypothetical protein
VQISVKLVFYLSRKVLNHKQFPQPFLNLRNLRVVSSAIAHTALVTNLVGIENQIKTLGGLPEINE